MACSHRRRCGLPHYDQICTAREGRESGGSMNSAIGRWFKAGALLFIATLIVAACEGAVGKAGDPGKAAGVPPQVTPIGDITLTAGQSAPAIDLSDHFNDPDGAAGATLTYTVASSNAAVASGSVTGGMLTVRASAVAGKAKLTVTATDAQKLTARAVVNVTVTAAPAENQAPMLEGKIAAKTVIMGQSVAIDASKYFKDPEGMALTYTASAGSDGDVTVVVEASTVTITGVVVGNATVTITASDGKLSANQMVEVKVIAATVGGQPVRKGTIPPMTLDAGVAKTVDLSMYFEHPDQGVALSYTATSSNSNAADTTVVGSTLTVTAKAVATKTTVEITVVASDTDPVPQQATQRFMVTVNASEPTTPPTGGVTPGSTAISIPVDKASVELDVDTYLEDGEVSTSYKVYSSDTEIFTATPKAGSTSIWVLAAKSHGSAIARIESITDGSIEESITVTVPNRKPEPNAAMKPPTLTLSVPMLSKKQDSTNKNGDSGPMVFDVITPSAPPVSSVQFSTYFKDKDGADKSSLVYSITTSREDVLVHNGGTCKSQSACAIQLDVLKKAGGEGAQLYLEVTAKDSMGAISDPVRFPVVSKNPAMQTYITDKFADGYRGITVGFRDVNHKVQIDPLESVLKAPDAPASTTTPKETLAAFSGVADTPLVAYTTAATGSTTAFIVLGTLEVPALPATGTQDMQVVAVAWSDNIASVSLSGVSSPTEDDTVTFSVKGPGSGKISFVYYVLDATSGTFMWIKSKNTVVLPVTVVDVK